MFTIRKLQTLVANIVTAGIVAAVLTTWFNGGFEPQVRAEPRRVTPQEPDQHFKSGGRLSEAVLQELLTVIKRIDERLARIEKSAEQIAGGSRGIPPRAEVDPNQASGSAPIQVRRSR